MLDEYENLSEEQKKIFDNLTEKEKNVLIIMSQGLGLDEIAERSGIDIDELYSVLEGMEKKGIIKRFP